MHDHRLASALQAAAGRIQAAVMAAVDKAALQLAPLALSATSGTVRMELMDAERELRTKSGRILEGFQTQLLAQINESTTTQCARPIFGQGELDWDALSLVGDDEVERGVMADRLAQTLVPECDETLKVMCAQFSTLMDEDHLSERNPLHPLSVAKALLNSLAQAECQPSAIQTLTMHIGRLLGAELNTAYSTVTQEMRAQGIAPRGISLARQRSLNGSTNSAFRPTTSGITSSASPDGADHGTHTSPGSNQGRQGWGAAGQDEVHASAVQSLSKLFGVPLPNSAVGTTGPFAPNNGQADSHSEAAKSDFQQLLRKLAIQPAQWPGSDNGLAASESGTAPLEERTEHTSTGCGFAGPLIAPNVIRAHRDELLSASGGTPINQIVIDIVAALFDQVLSDPKVAPEIARQIARLQLPVLRIALEDIAFFSSRKHPVRRFVNRIANLAGTIDEHDSNASQACVNRVTELISEIVEGDFALPSLYEEKLGELERHIEQVTSCEAAEQAAVAALLNSKEADLRVHQRYTQILKKELAEVDLPEFLRAFLTQIWSQVQVMAAARHGADSTMAKRMKKAGHELALSVQPKGHPQLRKAFLLGLPQLMKDLNDGLAMIQWPEEAKQHFFGQLLPSHAESLKALPHHEFTQRMLEQRLKRVGELAIPSREEAANDPLPSPQHSHAQATALSVVTALSPEETLMTGFVSEAAVSCDAPLDINLDAPIDPSLADIDIKLDCPPTPSAGTQLAHHIQKGAAYQMLMQSQWKKVRLTWVSEGRTFFVFTHGHTHKQTISLTARTLSKMCETGRFKAFEQAELIERATLRARRQLAALAQAGRERSAA